MKTCAAASEHNFYVSANMWLLLDLFQSFLKNMRLLLKDINERLLLNEKCAAAFRIYIFYVEDCVAASRNISMFFNERAAASEKIFNDCF